MTTLFVESRRLPMSPTSLPGVAPRETLQQLIARRLSELEMSARTAATHSHGLVSHATLARYGRNEGGKLTADTAQGIALALDVPAKKVFEAAGMPNPPGRFELPARADLLTAKERRAVISVMDAMLAARGALPSREK